MNIRRYVLPSALILLLGLGIGVAQNINRAIQLSQDSTGAFGVDSALGVYFPAHILSPLNKAPIPSVSGTGTPTLSGTDYTGTITMGTSATTATVIFGTTFVSVPSCVLGWPAVLAAETYTLATTSIAITQTATTGNKITYICPSAG